jgi:hypothetical protein
MADAGAGNEETKMKTKSRLRAVTAIFAATVALGVVGVSPATAVYEHITPGFNFFNVTTSSVQAGGHPDLEFAFEFRYDDETECPSECLFPRFSRVDMPTGFIGNPHVTPRCSLSDFAAQKCPSDSQVGTFLIELGGSFKPWVGVYNLQTRVDQAGLLGFTAGVIGLPFLLELTGRTDSDYGLRTETSPLLRFPLPGVQRINLWGVPQSAVHDVNRFVVPIVGAGICQAPLSIGCPSATGGESPTFAPSSSALAPFLQNPVICGVPLSVIGTLLYHSNAGERAGPRGEGEVPWPEMTGCNQMSFTPSVVGKPTTTSADTASGLDTSLKVPQTQSAETPAPSEIRKVRVTLPPGFTINPNAADGKVACPDALSGIGTLGPADCPEFSKIGTLMLDVAALPAPIPGALYLAEPRPGEPYRVLLTASGFATNVKLLGRADPDPQTGQISIVFDNLPQSPLQEFDLHVFGSERGLLATPSHCGTYTMEGEFVPWNDKLSTRFTKSLITVDSGPNGMPCPIGPRPLAPQFRMGAANNTAGTSSPLSISLTRSDGEQNLTGVTFKAPLGALDSLKGVSYCPQSALDVLANPTYSGAAEQQASACPPSSLIGTVVAGAGAGSHPLYVSGKAYLAGPYKGAPVSIIAVVPAVSGPYDLGVVATRIATYVDPVTARVTAISDPLPQILEGVPLRVRSILVNLDRPNFALNPTNCDPLSSEATVLGNEGGVASLTANFQVANCADLAYGPKLGLTLTGGVRRRGHPATHATFVAGPGEANTRMVSVALPAGELLDNAHIGTICTRVQFAADNCPPGSLIGTAEATTPLLDDPLEGKVYLRSSSNELPDVAVDLEGQIDVELTGRIDTARNGALRTNFETVPDAPVRTFKLDLMGGSKGLLINSKSLCGQAKHAKVKMIGQNGARVSSKVKLQTACGKKARHKRRNRGKAGR